MPCTGASLLLQRERLGAHGLVLLRDAVDFIGVVIMGFLLDAVTSSSK